mmetsp:Transcript_22193/g.39977  ORF Transcript_22193/g.39977 Transcript_22193/m.39977 type:complete len:200 (+) Transcript_22193:46-645(+)
MAPTRCFMAFAFFCYPSSNALTTIEVSQSWDAEEPKIFDLQRKLIALRGRKEDFELKTMFEKDTDHKARLAWLRKKLELKKDELRMGPGLLADELPKSFVILQNDTSSTNATTSEVTDSWWTIQGVTDSLSTVPQSVWIAAAAILLLLGLCLCCGGSSNGKKAAATYDELAEVWVPAAQQAQTKGKPGLFASTARAGSY